MRTEITREIQLDIGHRIPNHRSLCRNVHGHRYRIVARAEGNLVREEGTSEEGMIADFGSLKEIMMREIHEKLDHAFMVWKDDSALRDFLLSQDYRVAVFEDIPTAENLARWCFERVEDEVVALWKGRVRLCSVTVWETPNCSATFFA